MTRLLPVDEDDLRSRLVDRLGPDTVSIESLHPQRGGRSGLTYAAVIREGDASRTLVVKVSPPGLAPTGNRDVIRQARLMTWLDSHSLVPVPTIVAFDEGSPPRVPPFFAMDWIDGESMEPVSDRDIRLPAPGVIRERAFTAARLLAALHTAQLDGRPALEHSTSSIEDEIAKWERAFESVSSSDMVDGWSACAATLRTCVPAPVPSCLVHGDWRLGNMICADAQIMAVIDWELWSTADPRIDLAWFLVTTVADGNPIARRAVPGMPTAGELVAIYADQLGIAVKDLGWFIALARFKGAATMALNVKYNRTRSAPDPEIESRASVVSVLLRSAVATIGGEV